MACNMQCGHTDRHTNPVLAAPAASMHRATESRKQCMLIYNHGQALLLLRHRHCVVECHAPAINVDDLACDIAGI